MQPRPRSRFQNEQIILISILLLALANGLLYVFIMPPWQHYDEPNHFEFIWLLVERGRRPEPGDYDTGMRQALAQSMVDHGFYRGHSTLPDLQSEKPWIGQFAQLDEPQLYYLLASLPVRLLQGQDLAVQLSAARLVSLALFLVTVFAGYGLVTEITPSGHPLRLLVPLTMALLPAFVDLMTAVNNDVAAIMAFSIFLWGSLRLVRRGPSWPDLLWVLAACTLCLLTKRTVYLVLPLLGITLLFTFLQGRFRKLVWGLLIVAAAAGLFAVFAWGDPALWYRNTPQNSPTRRSSAVAPTGQAAFQLNLQPGGEVVKLAQIIPGETARTLSGQPLTLGAWIWASQPVAARTPVLRVYDGKQTYGEVVQISKEPQFFALHLTPQGDSGRAWVILEPSQTLELPAPVYVYYDDVVLAEGSYPLDQAPQLDGDGAAGTWGGVPFENLVRNPSAESGWVYLRPWADQLGSLVFSDYRGQERFSLTVYSLIDLPASAGYYQIVLTNLFRTFWAKFGWGHVPLAVGKPYALILLPLTLLAFLGLGLAAWQNRRRLNEFPWDALFILGLTSLLFWGVTMVRGSTYLLTRIYVPVARYAYPAIIPTVLFLSAGWNTLLSTMARWLRLPGWVRYALYAGFFAALNFYALVSIWQFYRG